MKKILVTGFDPFDGQPVNPAREAVMRLPDTVGGYEITKLEIPTVFGLAAETVLKVAEELRPHAILCVGQAGGRAAVTPEVVGINLREAGIADNAGVTLSATPIDEKGPAAYFSTLPVRKIVADVKSAGIPCALSYSAGAFVCNDLLYSLLHALRDENLPIGFIHVPFLPEQAKGTAPSLPLEVIAQALTVAIRALEASLE